MPPAGDPPADDDFTTVQVARMLGMAVRSVQLMVDRGELEGWKTPGGHRRISRASVESVLAARRGGERAKAPPPAPAAAPGHAKVLLIEDSAHYQNLVTLLVRKEFPEVQLQVAADGITGLAQFGRFAPDVLIVDILLPGIDGAALVSALRSSPQFNDCQLMIVTSLDEEHLAPFAYALEGLPVIHKSRVVAELPPLLAQCLARRHAPAVGG